MSISPDSRPAREIVVVGGGTAGWIVAGVLAARYPRRGDDGVTVTLIESRTQSPIGVGEGTWPTIRATLRQIGVSETDFLRECDASFKQGSTFRRWVDGAPSDAYHHPFTPPVGYEEDAVAPYWLEDSQGLSFVDSVCFQGGLCDRSLAPKQITTPEYSGLANYAYHLDAGKLGSFLQKHCIEKLGVRHVYDEIIGVESLDSGDITRLVTQSGVPLGGDLFIDCSGFAGLLIGKHYGVPFVSMRDILFIDRAWAVQLAYANEDAPIASTTLSTAQSSGWVWDIGLTSRRGVGYVYSSGYTSDEDALDELKAYVGPASGRDLSFRKININCGYRQLFWTHNCLAIGLSAGFLEPLEASAIVMIELSAKWVANMLPSGRAGMARAARMFNETFRYHWERIVDFLKLHYALSRRVDGPFWIENRCRESLPNSLIECLEFWKQHCPWHDDFQRREEVFSAASYQYVLYGMGFKTEPAPWLLDDYRRKAAREKMAETARYSGALSSALPGNRDLLNRIRRFGLQKI
jgi:tryptophan halogenase